jgi:regulator of protease activity HflC (stomatin/prohibitin superfamily)
MVRNTFEQDPSGPLAQLGNIDFKRWLKAGGYIAGGILAVILLFGIVVVNDADKILVVQGLGGGLTSYTDAGPKAQWFGKCTFYKKRDQFSFSSKPDQGSKKDESLPVQFNDGGTAKVSGVISWEMPMSHDKIIKLHTLYGSQAAIDQQLIRPAIERSIYLTGPLMSSAEAYSARKPDLLRFFEDQARNGVYQMETISEKQPDPITGIMKTVSLVKIAMDEKNQPKRQSSSQVAEFGIVLLSPAIDAVTFQDTVQKQISDQQSNFMAVQTAKSKALQAEQDALTAAKNGEAEAAKAKWKQEVEKATEVTRAEKERDVAALGVKTAELNKQKLILEGQGEATKRQLIMTADGALDKKLAAWLESQKYWADGFGKHDHPLVPTMQWGGGSGVGGNVGTQFMDLMSAKAARDLGLDLSMARGQAKAEKKQKQ